MNYVPYATGPNGESIVQDTKGNCYFLNNRGNYEPLRFEDTNSNYIDVNVDNFSQSGSFYINGTMVSPGDCVVSSINSDENVFKNPYSGNNAYEMVGAQFMGSCSSILSGALAGEVSNIALMNSSDLVHSITSQEGFDFTIDSEVQNTLSLNLSTAADAFEQKVSLMYREIGNMGNFWVGEDYDAYCHATDGYKTALGDLSDSIRMYGKHFEKMSSRTEDLTNELIEVVETCTNRHVN